MNKKIIIVAIPVILGVLLCLGYLLVNQRGLSASITIEVVPSGSRIKLDSKSGKEGVNRVKPGQHKVLVSRPGFASAEQDVELKKGENRYVGIGLNPNTNQTANWYSTHPNDRSKYESISSKNFDSLSKQISQEVPLIKKLPWIGAGFEYRIDYGVPPEGASGEHQVAIYITAPNQKAQQDALTWIEHQGYDPSKLEIVYKISNP